MRELYAAVWRATGRDQLLLILLSLLVGALAALPLKLQQLVINDLVYDGDLVWLAWLCAGFLAAVLASAGLKFVLGLRQAMVGERTVLRIRKTLYRNAVDRGEAAEPGTLVAMATHGYSGAARWLLGSVAEKVADGLTTDLLLLRPEQTDTGGESALRTVLVPLDFSAAAEAILPTVTELSKSLNWQMILIHVTKRFYSGQPEILPPTFGGIPNLKEIWEQDTAAANEYLTGVAQRL